MKYEIRYALGGSFGGIEMADPEILDFDCLEDADEYAYKQACELYKRYSGSRGLRCVEQIMVEDGLVYKEAEEVRNKVMESWLEYDAVPCE